MVTREQWKTAREKLDVIEVERARLLEPTDEAFAAAQEALALIEDTTGHHVGFCEGCSEPIFSEDKYHVGADVYLCEQCSPSYHDMVAHPEMFRGNDDEPMSPDEAKSIANAHVAAGGTLSDRLAS